MPKHTLITYKRRKSSCFTVIRRGYCSFLCESKITLRCIAHKYYDEPIAGSIFEPYLLVSTQLRHSSSHLLIAVDTEALFLSDARQLDVLRV